MLSSAGSSDLWPDHAGLRISGSVCTVSGCCCGVSVPHGSKAISFSLRRRMYTKSSQTSDNRAAAPPADPKAIPIFCPVLSPDVPLTTMAVSEGTDEALEEVDVAVVRVLVDAGDIGVVSPLLEERDGIVVEVEADVEVRECSDSYAETSFHVTLCPRLAGKDRMSVSRDASLKATVLEVSGHQQGNGSETVLPPSSQATHSLEVPLQ